MIPTDGVANPRMTTEFSRYFCLAIQSVGLPASNCRGIRGPVFKSTAERETTDSTDDTDEYEISVRIRVNPCPSVVPFFSCVPSVSWFILHLARPGRSVRPGHALYEYANCQRTNCQAANAAVCCLDFSPHLGTGLPGNWSFSPRFCKEVQNFLICARCPLKQPENSSAWPRA